ncbi:MAG: hypothetical protein RBT36_02915 [Desulfobulbus sp.]|jgi:hypothetical protein|nr:hypothetical protein [Desulfobulbus sp.]
MKKVLVTGAALLLASGMVSTASAAAVEPGVKITGDARARLIYKNSYDFGQKDLGDQTNMDSRIRFNVVGTAAGGAYAKARIRVADSYASDFDTDLNERYSLEGDNIWVDIAVLGVPFNDQVTVEAGKYRVTYGPGPTTTNFFYDDVSLAGVRGIITTDNLEFNPFVEWMDEAQISPIGEDRRQDNDEMRFGGHLKAKVNENWIVGGMLGYQIDDREVKVVIDDEQTQARPNEGLFASIYTNGKSGPIGFQAELGYTENKLNGFNNWREDRNWDGVDNIGSDDNGFGGYVMPSYTIDALTLALNVGFTQDGFLPDRAFGFVMIGSEEPISAVKVGDTGDWIWGGLVAMYQVSENLKLTGNLVYASVSSWDRVDKIGTGDGPWTTTPALDDAWEISGKMQYTISKGADFYWLAGYLAPSFDDSSIEDDGAFGTYAKFELKF